MRTSGKVILDGGKKNGFWEECTKFKDKRDIDKDEIQLKKAKFEVWWNAKILPIVRFIFSNGQFLAVPGVNFTITMEMMPQLYQQQSQQWCLHKL